MSVIGSKIPVIAIFDIGKTNKKFLLFNESYEVVFERSVQLGEIQDEDGEPCEDLSALTNWVKSTYDEASQNPEFNIEALNFSTYGASFVHLDRTGKPCAPLYNYLKKFPAYLHQKFYTTYGDENEIARATASPILGNLNSGLQLYLIKHAKPKLFKEIKVSLHLPQYISSLFTGRFFSDITSIGCHTQLWDFDKKDYHRWVAQENLDDLLPPVTHSDLVLDISTSDKNIRCGIGLHDSSAALIPYLKKFSEPFMLLSTGTWCISLNPFNHSTLTADELKQDCLCYLSYQGKPVKASRLFSGHEHEQQIKRLATHFNKAETYFSTVTYQNGMRISKDYNPETDLTSFQNYDEAYHALINSLVRKQFSSSMLVLKDQPVKHIFVDGGFSKNDVFMNLLAKYFPALEVFSSSVAQASALGAAMVINGRPENSLPNFPIHQYKSNPSI